jgi:hypothetical protein
LNRWSLLRTNLVTELRTLLPAAHVEEIAQPAGVGAITMPAIGVCRPGGRATEAAEIAWHINQPADVAFQLVVRCDDATNNIAAMQAAEELATAALAVRNVDIGIYGTGDATDTGGVFLDYVKDDVMAFVGRDGGAGPIAIVISLRSTVLPI